MPPSGRWGNLALQVLRQFRDRRVIEQLRQVDEAREFTIDVFVNLDAGGCRIELRRRSGRLIIRPLTSAEFAFRVTLAGGGPLAEAVTAALDQPDEFDFYQAFAELFAEQWAIGWINESRMS